MLHAWAPNAGLPRCRQCWHVGRALTSQRCQPASCWLPAEHCAAVPASCSRCFAVALAPLQAGTSRRAATRSSSGWRSSRCGCSLPRWLVGFRSGLRLCCRSGNGSGSCGLHGLAGASVGAPHLASASAPTSATRLSPYLCYRLCSYFRQNVDTHSAGLRPNLRKPPLPLPLQGSAAISSDAYFGREQRSSGASGSNVDMTAGDLISKVSITARQDMDSLKQVRRRPCFRGSWHACAAGHGQPGAGLLREP